MERVSTPVFLFYSKSSVVGWGILSQVSLTKIIAFAYSIMLSIPAYYHEYTNHSNLGVSVALSM